MIVVTESGTEYEFEIFRVRRLLPKTKSRVRRLLTRASASLRRDGEWLNLLGSLYIEVGKPMTMVLEPLGEFGVTVRVTSPVIEIRERR